MTTFHLILKEASHRRLNFLLSVLAVTTAVALFIAFLTTARAATRETTRLMRDMGFNVRILPKKTDMGEFWLTGSSDQTMPQNYLARLASHEGISYAHLIGVLERTVPWRGGKVILTGITPEAEQPDKRHSAMIFTVKPGTVYVGFEVARRAGLKKGDAIEILGTPFTVAECRPQRGTEDDIRVYGSLPDVQRVLKLEGQINEIKAMECTCLTEGTDPLVTLRQELERILPEAQVFAIRPIAEARKEQRLMVQRYFSLIMPLVLVVCAVWIGALAMLNVRERQPEIGTLRALGYGSGKVASLFLGKPVIVGAAAAVLGFAVGTGVALAFGPDIFKITAKLIKPQYGLLVVSLIAAPAFAALSSLIPAMVAVTQDPADILRKE